MAEGTRMKSMDEKLAKHNEQLTGIQGTIEMIIEKLTTLEQKQGNGENTSHHRIAANIQKLQRRREICIESIDCQCVSCFDDCLRKKKENCLRSVDCQCNSCLLVRENQIEVIESMVESANQENQSSEDVFLTEKDNALNILFTVEVSCLKTSLSCHPEFISCELHRMGQSVNGFDCDITPFKYGKDCELNGSLKLFDEMRELDIVQILCLSDDYSSNIYEVQHDDGFIVFDPGGIGFDGVNQLEGFHYRAKSVTGALFPLLVYCQDYGKTQLAYNVQACGLLASSNSLCVSIPECHDLLVVQIRLPFIRFSAPTNIYPSTADEVLKVVRRFNELLAVYWENIKLAVGGLQNSLLASSLLGWDITIGVALYFGDVNGMIEVVHVDMRVAANCWLGGFRSHETVLHMEQLAPLKELPVQLYSSQLVFIFCCKIPAVTWWIKVMLPVSVVDIVDDIVDVGNSAARFFLSGVVVKHGTVDTEGCGTGSLQSYFYLTVIMKILNAKGAGIWIRLTKKGPLKRTFARKFFLAANFLAAASYAHCQSLKPVTQYVIRALGFGDNRRASLEDISSVLINIDVINEECGFKLNKAQIGMNGLSKKAIGSRDYTEVLHESGDKVMIGMGELQPRLASIAQLILWQYCRWHWQFSGCSITPATPTRQLSNSFNVTTAQVVHKKVYA